jgi:signal transduction histidine kinase
LRTLARIPTACAASQAHGFAWIDRAREIARLVAEGEVDLVDRTGDFVSLAAALIERRLRWAATSTSSFRPPVAGLPGGLGGIFSHEINNPLTGILGNAEPVLLHRDRLAAIDAHRLQTVVDLAVPLRETIRRLSNTLEANSPAAKSAWRGGKSSSCGLAEGTRAQV